MKGPSQDSSSHDEWDRSSVLYECSACGAYTDLIQIRKVSTRSRNYGSHEWNPWHPAYVAWRKVHCPNDGRTWHDILTDKIKNLFARNHPANYRDYLIEEILYLRQKSYHQRKDDVSGPLSRKKEMFTTGSTITELERYSSRWENFGPLLHREIVEA